MYHPTKKKKDNYVIQSGTRIIILLLINMIEYVVHFSVICIVNIVHFNSSPYIMCYNELLKINSEIENVGLVLGISRISIIFNVIIPKVKHSIIEMFSYYFVNSMMTISAVAFLSPPSPKPVSLMINQFEAQLLMESAAFVTILILLANIILKFLLTFFKSFNKIS